MEKLTAEVAVRSPLVTKATLPPFDWLMMLPPVTVIPPVTPAVPTVAVTLKALPAVGYVVPASAVMVTPLADPVIEIPRPPAALLVAAIATCGPVMSPARVVA